jgi:4-oxalocrotonate tautomerase
MLHVIVKAWPGKSEEQKQRLSEAITRDVMEIFDYGADSVSVSVEEVAPDRWREDVYLPDIQAGSGKLHKKPGYKM